MSLVLRGGRLPTADGTADILIDGGSIVRIAQAGTLRGDEVVSLDGRWVVPGLWDQHVHFTQWAQTARRLDVSGAVSAAEAAELVRRRTARDAGDDPIVGFGFHDALWPDLPTRELLDSAAGDRPVVLIAGDLHCCWLNTAAARMFAPESAADPSAAVLREDESFAVTSRLSAAGDETLDRWAKDAAHAAAARGVVGIVDLEFAWNLDVWTRRFAGGFDSLRVEFGIYGDHLQRAIDQGLRTGMRIAGTEERLTVGPFKVITDGSLNTRTAYCFDPYPDGGHGVQNLTPVELGTAMALAASAGIEPAIHAIGDHANRIALDAFERVGCTGRIEHAQLLTNEDVRRFAELGVVASVQPEHSMDDRDVADVLWAGRTGRAFPLAALHRAGVRLAFGSDAPVAPLDPWIAMAAAVARSRGGREPWHPEQAVARRVALASSVRSDLAPGEPADLAVLDEDPFGCGLTELRAMPVAATLLAGAFTHDALR
ncbi:amidohydrolase [Leifsonia sp. NPDC058230]|uniref:amidohydrolase n=1 Tax=Leifsonia sp. NPDC058230 TaxID=3346391 RepID=UPI0036D82F02